jgi:DNA primase
MKLGSALDSDAVRTDIRPMSLPPGFVDELRARTSLSQVVGRKVTWDRRKSNPGRGDHWAPCPFHQEKTASFHVDDKKGYFHCFGCQAGGDVFKFVQETENVGFMEAVEILAREAGMTMPARDPKAQERLDRTAQLVEVMEQALRHFRLQLKTAAGAPARDYLAGRGLSADALDRWEIGFAPPGWTGLADHLRGRGVAPDLLLAAGLVKPSDKGRAPYDVFRNRIIFPIRDARGRCIAFGGRAMDPADSAKYLNSPETELFDKGRSLFNHAPAREAAGKGRPLVVAEGYMDVIALSEAGFPATVAPLGTAITEDQLKLLWRIHPEPLVALDGDRAGLNAALRLIDLALPLLEAGRSLRFAILPEGQDPDDLIRGQGAPAMQRVLDAAQPMVSLLWRRETEGHVFDSPERRAALDRTFREKLQTIRDLSLRRHYGEEIDRLRRELFFPGRPAPRAPGAPWTGGRFQRPPAKPLPTTRRSLLASGNAVDEQMREAVILAALLVNPWLVHRFEGELERLEITVPEHGRILATLMRLGPGATQALLTETLGEETLEKLFAPRHVVLCAGVRHSGNPEIAEQCVEDELRKLFRARGARRDIAEAERDIAGLADEGITWRLRQAAEGQAEALRGRTEDKTEFEVADNGARISKDEKAASQAVYAAIDFGKSGRKSGRTE